MAWNPWTQEDWLESEEDLRRAQIKNLTIDTDYKRGLMKYEPWKVVITALGAGAAFTLAVIALLSYLHR